jgi:Flp pilus assembly protein TadD, contains TPR repeats
MKKLMTIMLVVLCIVSGCSKENDTNTIQDKQQEINALMEKGDEQYLNGEYPEAKANYAKVIELDETYVSAYINKARATIKLEEYEDSKNNLKKASELLIGNLTAPYYDVVAELAVKQNRKAEAIEALNNAIAIETTAVRLSNRGQVFSLLHQNEQAKADLHQAIEEIEGQIFANYYYLTEIAIYEENYPEAEKHLAKMIEKKPENSEAPAMQGYINAKKIANDNELTREQKNELEHKASEKITEATEKFESENNEITANYIGLYHYVNENVEIALEFYNKAINLDDKEASFYNNRALAYYTLGDNDSAYQDMSEAIKLDNLEAEYYLGRGYILVTRKQKASAIGDFSRAVELDGTYINRIPSEYHEELPENIRNGGQEND